MSGGMEEIRVVLLGKTGSGKSSFGNTLIGEEAFDSARGLSSGTQKCNWVQKKINGMKLSITDTPGLCDTHRQEEEVLLEVGKSIAVACPGPHVVIIVIPCNRRFTKEEYDAVKTLLALFGENVRRFLIVVFSGGDDLKVPIDGMQKALDEQIKRASEDLKEVLCDAYNRYYVVDNCGTKEQRKQHAAVVLGKIQELIRKNGNKYFSNDMVDKYNKKVQEIIERRKKDHHLTNEEADKEARQAIVEEKEGVGFFDMVKTVAKDYILPVVGNIAAGAAYGAVSKRCSVM